MEKKRIMLRKQIADYSIIGDASNVEFVSQIIKKNKINALMVGVVDVLVSTYEKFVEIKNYPVMQILNQ